MTVPPVASEAAGIAIVPVISTVHAGSPTRPIGRSVRMSTLPVVHAADLILPTIVDVGNSAPINVRPRRTIADRCIFANVDLANINWSIVDQIVSGPIADVRPVTDVVADSITDIRAVSVSIIWSIAICDPITNTRRNRPRKRGWFDRPVHSQGVTKITG